MFNGTIWNLKPVLKLRVAWVAFCLGIGFGFLRHEACKFGFGAPATRLADEGRLRWDYGWWRISFHCRFWRRSSPKQRREMTWAPKLHTVAWFVRLEWNVCIYERTRTHTLNLYVDLQFTCLHTLLSLLSYIHQSIYIYKYIYTILSQSNLV